MNIGKKLKELRTQKKLSLEKLAAKVGLTRSFISQVEKDKTSPSLPSLIKIVSALDMSVAEFFQTVEEKRSVHIKGAERKCYQDIEAKTKIASLSSGFRNAQMEPFYVEFEGERISEIISLQGESFVFVLDGALEVIMGKESHRLQKGDSLYFDGSVPHRVIPDGDKKSSALFVAQKGVVKFH